MLGQRIQLPRGNARGYRKYKEHARAIVHEKILKWNAHYKLPVKRIFIKNQKTRWGSCSAHGNLNFNYRIVYLPDAVADYLVVHELCHLKQMNHSRAFWDLVAEALPSYRSLRGELRRMQ